MWFIWQINKDKILIFTTLLQYAKWNTKDTTIYALVIRKLQQKVAIVPKGKTWLKKIFFFTFVNRFWILEKAQHTHTHKKWSTDDWCMFMYPGQIYSNFLQKLHLSHNILANMC